MRSSTPPAWPTCGFRTTALCPPSVKSWRKMTSITTSTTSTVTSYCQETQIKGNLRGDSTAQLAVLPSLCFVCPFLLRLSYFLIYTINHLYTPVFKWVRVNTLGNTQYLTRDHWRAGQLFWGLGLSCALNETGDSGIGERGRKARGSSSPSPFSCPTGHQHEHHEKRERERGATASQSKEGKMPTADAITRLQLQFNLTTVTTFKCSLLSFHINQSVIVSLTRGNSKLFVPFPSILGPSFSFSTKHLA